MQSETSSARQVGEAEPGVVTKPTLGARRCVRAAVPGYCTRYLAAGEGERVMPCFPEASHDLNFMTFPTVAETKGR